MGRRLAWFQNQVRGAVRLCCCCFPSCTKAKRINCINGHSFEKQRLTAHALCAYCGGRFRKPKNKCCFCKACGMVVHKGCRWAAAPCKEDPQVSCTPIVKETKDSLDKCPPVDDAHCSEKAQISCTAILEEAKESSDKCPPDEEQSKSTSECQGQVDVKEPCEIIKTDVTLEDFSTIKMLGEGGYGKVFLVRSKQDNKEHAMKVIKKRTVCDSMDMLWTEKMVLQLAASCPFLIRLHSCFQTPSWLCFLTNYARGGDMAELIEKHGVLPEDHIRFYAAEIALGLDFLHKKGIIHRDIKLDNILIDHEGHAQITDFGLCKMVKGTDEEEPLTLCGTPVYCAPEIIAEEEYGFAVDWWALGICLLVMAVGAFPYPDEISMNSYRQMIPLLQKPLIMPEGISDEFSQLLHGFLQKDPEERLGGDPQNGLSHIQQHPFFHGLDWDKVQQKQIKPPYQPPAEQKLSPAGGQLAQITPDETTSDQVLDQSQFAGFDYVAPS